MKGASLTASYDVAVFYVYTTWDLTCTICLSTLNNL